MNAPPGPSETKDILVREYDRRVATGQPNVSISYVAACISTASGSNLTRTVDLLTDALIERGDIDPVCPDFIPAWLEGEAAS